MKQILTTLKEKWPEYLIEAIVIVASILGAYALDNWNDSRKEQQQKGEFIEQLTTNYEANLLQLNQKIKMHEALVNAGYLLLETFDSSVSLDTTQILKNLSIMSVDPTFDPTSSEMQLTSQINLINDPNLRLLLTNWDSDIAALREVELAFQNQAYNHFIPHLASMGVYRDVASYLWDNDEFNNEWLLGSERILTKKITKSKGNIDLTNLLSDRTLEGFIALGIDLNESALEQAYAVEKKIMRILLLLEQEKNS